MLASRRVWWDESGVLLNCQIRDAMTSKPAPGRCSSRRRMVAQARAGMTSAANSCALRAGRLERSSWKDPMATFETRMPRNSASRQDAKAIASTPKNSSEASASVSPLGSSQVLTPNDSGSLTVEHPGRPPGARARSRPGYYFLCLLRLAFLLCLVVLWGLGHPLIEIGVLAWISSPLDAFSSVGTLSLLPQKL